MNLCSYCGDDATDGYQCSECRQQVCRENECELQHATEHEEAERKRRDDPRDRYRY